MTHFYRKNCVLILTKILLCRIIKLSEVICMKIYYFTVMINSDHRGFYVTAKTLSDALKFLDSELIECYRGLTDWFNYRVCQTYSVLSDSGKRSHRTLRRIVKGMV